MYDDAMLAIPMQTQLNDQYLTVEQVARHLSVTPATLRRWLRDGKILGTRIGPPRAGYRIAESEVMRVLRGEPIPEPA